MQITKKWLKGAKRRLLLRLKQLCAMNHDQLLVEVNRMYPGMEISTTGPDEHGKLLEIAMQWAIETTLPASLCDY